MPMETTTIHPTTTATNIRDLNVGDELTHLGMHLLVLQAPRLSQVHDPDNHGGCWTARCQVLNAENVPNALVPTQWMRDDGAKAGVEFGWTVQGNDLGKVHRITD